MPDKFGKRILTLRKTKGLSQEELSNKLEVPKPTISKWESGKVLPDIYSIINMSILFNVTTDYLLMGDAPKKTLIIPNPITTKERKALYIIGCIIGICLILLLPLIAKIYQLAEFAIFNTSYTYATNYIWEWPVKGILIIGIILLSINCFLLIKNTRRITKCGK